MALMRWCMSCAHCSMSCAHCCARDVTAHRAAAAAATGSVTWRCAGGSRCRQTCGSVVLWRVGGLGGGSAAPLSSVLPAHCFASAMWGAWRGAAAHRVGCPLLRMLQDCLVCSAGIDGRMQGTLLLLKLA
ncbi:hypothetical protein COO60DRAFT_1567073 [Scenedesmus sp. NREL 46B-D3]|nr:hypothetical protein COO60DRAFT_1567073 [Scenedesmus sp. NREL 46B-D3]